MSTSDSLQALGTRVQCIASYADLDAYVASVRPVLDMDLEHLVPGHAFMPFDESQLHGADVRRFLDISLTHALELDDLISGIRRDLGEPLEARSVAARVCAHDGLNGVSAMAVGTVDAHLRRLRLRSLALEVTRCALWVGGDPGQFQGIDHRRVAVAAPDTISQDVVSVLLPTSVVGSYAWPSWVWSSLESARRGESGPADMREVLDDAVDMALRDQEDADIDIVTDGEMRRLGFFTAEFYRHITGLKPLDPDRRLGVTGHDQQHRFEVVEPIHAPEGLGVVAEFEYARARTRRPLKVTLPGPFTLAGRLLTGPVYRTREDAAWAFVPLLNRELEALVAAGAEFIQLDEPSPAIHPDAPADFANLFNAAVERVAGRVRLAAHLCFGNYVGRPLAKRTYAPVLDQMLRFHVDQLVLEFANREMAQLELCREIARHADVAVGVIDVKSYYVETADDVAERARQALEFVPVERLSLVPDCGFSQTPRWAARQKLRALGAGARLIREEFSSRT